MSFIYNMADTWNAVGTTFNAILMNVSNGAGGAPVGAAASRVLNLQANSASVFSVDIGGGIRASAQAAISLTTNGSSGLSITNNSNGGNAAAAFLCTNDTPVQGQFGAASSGYTPYGSIAANTSFMYNGSGGGIAILADNAAASVRLAAGATGTAQAALQPTGSFVFGSASIATNATDGFLYIETCAGQPTGTPTAFTGRVPLIFDTTNNQFWIYTGGAWKQPKTPAAAATITWQ